MKILRLSDVAVYVGIPIRTLYRMIDAGRFALPIPNTKPRRWNVADIDAWLGSRPRTDIE